MMLIEPTHHKQDFKLYVDNTTEKTIKKNKRCCRVTVKNQMNMIQTQHKKGNDEKKIGLAQSS